MIFHAEAQRNVGTVVSRKVRGGADAQEFHIWERLEGLRGCGRYGIPFGHGWFNTL